MSEQLSWVPGIWPASNHDTVLEVFPNLNNSMAQCFLGTQPWVQHLWLLAQQGQPPGNTAQPGVQLHAVKDRKHYCAQLGET